MVDLMLQQFGEIAIVSRLEFDDLTIETLMANRDLAMAFDLHEDREEAQAGVPDNDSLVATLDDLRVDQRPWLPARKSEKDDALKDTQLRSRDPASVAGLGAPVS